jgi:hypothetical protein
MPQPVITQLPSPSPYWVWAGGSLGPPGACVKLCAWPCFLKIPLEHLTRGGGGVTHDFFGINAEGQRISVSL